MGSIEKNINKEIEQRFRSCTVSLDLPGIDMQQIADQIGDKELIDALFTRGLIKTCKNCGRLFVTHNQRECYCNRKDKEGKSCKEIGPMKSRTTDPIKRVMDDARRLHLSRRSASGKDEAACKRYSDWLSFALNAEKACIDGEISISKLKEIVGRNYIADRAGKRGSLGKKICGTCRHSSLDIEKGDAPAYFCDNAQSGNYGCPVDTYDGCDDWEDSTES